MKKNLFTFLTLLSFGASAQIPGIFDKGFTINGYVTLDYGLANEKASTILLQPDNKIIVIGENIDTDPTKDKLIVSRVTDTGTKDATFGTNGFVAHDIGDNKEYGRDGILLADGKILVLGSANIGGTNHYVVARLTDKGAFDTSFGTAGKFSGKNGNTGAVIARSMCLQSDGKIVVVGESTGRFFIARLNANGTLDTSFGTNGATVVVSDLSGLVISKVLNQSGKFVIIGHGTNNTTSKYGIATIRIDATGKQDLTWGSSGFGDYNFGVNEYIAGAAILSDGKIIAVGRAGDGATTTQSFAVKLNANGTIDNTFGTNGATKIDANTVGFEDMRSVALQTDGKIVMAGVINVDMGIIRLNSNGTLDKTFNNTGFNNFNLSNYMGKEQYNAVAYNNKNGRLYAVGTAGLGSTKEDFVVARFTSGLTSVFDVDNNSIAVSAYPNPASHAVSVRYDLASSQNVRFEMYDLAGKRIAILGDGNREAGTQVESFDLPAHLSNGLYICRLITNSGTTNISISVLR
jgi:uncharacterized delta-60 repeat protein